MREQSRLYTNTSIICWSVISVCAFSLVVSDRDQPDQKELYERQTLPVRRAAGFGFPIPRGISKILLLPNLRRQTLHPSRAWSWRSLRSRATEIGCQPQGRSAAWRAGSPNHRTFYTGRCGSESTEPRLSPEPGPISHLSGFVFLHSSFTTTDSICPVSGSRTIITPDDLRLWSSGLQRWGPSRDVHFRRSASSITHNGVSRCKD